MATNINNLLGRLDASQQATVTFLSGVDSSGAVSSASYQGYEGSLNTPPSRSTIIDPYTYKIGTGAVVTYSFVPGSNAGFSQAEMNYATQALDLWSGMSNITFKYVASGGQVNFVHTGGTPGQPGYTTGTLYGGTKFDFSSDPSVEPTTKGYIQIDPSFGALDSYTDSLQGYGIGTLVHEAGHLLGLGHAGPYNYDAKLYNNQFHDFGPDQRSDSDVRQWTTMSYIDPTDTNAVYKGQYNRLSSDVSSADFKGADPYTPMGLDIFAAQRLYGAPTSTMFSGGMTFGFNSTIMYTDLQGNTSKVSMYDFSQDVTPVVTIFDTGSNNTLDLSGFAASSVVNLNDGEFSSTSGQHDNIFIEYGTQIDHVIGGAGDDTFTVNVRSDVIDGGGGFNTVKFGDPRSAYVLSYSGSAAILSNSSSGAAYRLTNIQQVQFGSAPAVALADLPRVTWTGPSGGHFGVGANWSDGRVPDGISQLRINSGANVVVTQQETNEVDSVVIAAGATIDVTSGRFVIDNQAAGSSNAGAIEVESGYSLYLAGGLTNSGTLGLYGGTLVTASRVVSLSGGGTVTLQGGHIGGRDASGTPLAYDTFSNVDNVISGSGSIGRAGELFPLQFHNGVNANVVASIGTLQVSGAITNDGIMGASDDGTLVVSGAVDQTSGGRLVSLGTNASVVLDGGTIAGGSISALTGTIEVSADETLNGVTLYGAMKVDAGTTLTLVGDIDGSGATIDASAGTLDVSQAHLHNVSIKLAPGADTNGLVLDGGSGSIGIDSPLSGNGLTLAGGIANTSTISLVGYGSPYGVDRRSGVLTIQGTAVITGGGRIVLSDSYGSQDPGTQSITGTASDVLDNEEGTIQGYGQVGAGLLGLVNGAKGTITATASTLTINPGVRGLVNTGLLQAAGGTLNLVGVVTNTGGTIMARNSTVDLVDATITGGQLQRFLSGSYSAQGSVNLASLALQATLRVDPGNTLGLSGTITNSGQIALHGFSSLFGADVRTSVLQVHGAVVLGGNGQVSLVDDSAGRQSGTQVITGTAGDSLENQDNSITGWGVIGGGAMALTNDSGGTITASGGTLTLDSGSAAITNKGRMQTSGGTLELGSAVANTGQIVVGDGGTLILHQRVDGGGFVSAGAGSAVVLDGGTVATTGGFATAANSTLEVTSSGTLDGTVQGGGEFIQLAGRTTVDAGSSLTVTGPIANYSTITVNGYGSPYGADARSGALVVGGAATLGGGGTIRLQDTYGAGGGGLQSITGDAGATLDLESQTVLGYGRVGDGKVAISNEALSTIQAQGGTLTLDTGTSGIANAGALTAVGGVLEVDSDVGNAGTIVAGAGGTVVLRGAITGGGTVKAAAGGTVTLDGATIGYDGTVSSDAGGAITVASTGSLTAYGTPMALNGATDVAAGATLELSGFIANAGTFTVHGNSDFYASASGTVSMSSLVLLSGGGTFRLQDDYGSNSGATEVVTGGSQAVFENVDNAITGYGTIGGGAMAFRNDAGGRVTAAGGVLTLDSGRAGIKNAGLMAAANGTLALNYLVRNTGGTIAATGGSVKLVNVTVDGGTLTSGAVSGGAEGSIEVVGLAYLYGLATSARVNAGPGTVLSLGGTIANSGTIALSGSSDFYSGARGTIQVVGEVRLSGGGAITMRDAEGDGASGPQALTGVSGGALDNVDNTIGGYGQIGLGAMSLTNEAGGVIVASGGTLVVDTGSASVANAGLMQAVGGTLEIDSFAVNDGAMDAGASGTVLIHGVVTNHGTIRADSGGTLKLAGGTLLGGGVSVASGATLDVSGSGAIATTAGAPLELGGTATVGNGALLLLSGGVHNTGLFDVHGASGGVSTLSIGGTVRFTGGGLVRLTDDSGASRADQVVSGGTFDNADNTVSGSAVFTAAVTNEAGGTFVAAGAGMAFDGGLANAGELRVGAGGVSGASIVNTGLIDGAGTLAAAVSGAGTIEAKGGTLTLTKAVSGALVVDAGSTMVVRGGAAAGTTLQFGGPGATLQIVPGAGSQPFNGRVIGSTAGDTIDLVGVAATGSSAGSTLTLSYGGQTIGTVTFDSGYVGSVASDGAGGTLITAAAANADPLFDAAYYLAQYPDIAAAGIDPYQHYMAYGWHEGRNPSALFNTTYYLNQNPDVKAAGINPLVHFEADGWREGRDPSAGFSVSGYLAAYPDVRGAGIDPLAHYVTNGRAEGRAAFAATPHATGPSDPLVDAAFVYAHNPGVAAAGLDAAAWYHSVGWTQGADPSALFSTAYYLNQNPDVKAAGVDPLAHFESSGWAEGRDPSAGFSLSGYLSAYPDVRAAGVDPLVHYVMSGKAEGRATFAATPHGTGPQDAMVDAAYVYAHNPGVAAAGLDASAWFHSVGWQQGANPDALFDTSFYLTQNPDVRAAGVDPLAHFEASGWLEGRQPSLAFDDGKYLSTYPDVRAAGVDPLLHYLTNGQTEGRMAFLTGGAAAADPLVDPAYFDKQLGATIVPSGTGGAEQAAYAYDHGGWQGGLNPSALFDTNYYLSHNPDIAAAHIDPLVHYEQYGWKEGRDPSAAFSTTKYLAAYGDVRAAGVDPLLHYVQNGQSEGRTAFQV